MKPKFDTPYTVDDTRSESFGTINDEVSLTQQSDAADCDINIIVDRFTKTGMLPQVKGEGLYEDFTNITNYRDAVDKVRAMEDAFAEVPAKIRQKFGNDPQEFAEYITDPANKADVEKMGLTNPPAPEIKPVRVIVDNPTPQTEVKK